MASRMNEDRNIRKAGLKVTVPRMKVLEILEGSSTRHMTAEDVYRALMDAGHDIGIATVYRVLTQFEGAGLVTRHHFAEGHAIFELNRGMHHDHIVCNQCGKIVEFIDETIEAVQQRVAAREGFALREHALILHGDCLNPECPEKKGSAG